MFFAAPGRLAGFVRATPARRGRRLRAAAAGSRPPSWTASSRSGSPTASASRTSTGRSSATEGERATRTPTPWRSASSCSAIATSTTSTPTGRCSTPMLEARACLPAVDAPDKKDLGRNGTYLVIRQLRQDVGASGGSCTGRPAAIAARADELAAALVGRTQAGVPLAAMRPRRRRVLRRSRRAAPQRVHLRRRPRRACAARSARTSAAPTRATRTTPAARPGSRGSSPTWGSAARSSART